MKDALHVGIKTIEKGTALRRLIKKNLQEFALAAIEECIGPKIVNLNLILKENLFQETPNRGPLPQVPYNKNQGQILSFSPQTLNIWQCCHQYTSPK